jgi:hypothetical protein
MRSRALLLGASLLALITVEVMRVDAHKPITSKYTYSEDVFPIVNSRCGGCHVSGGVAPMSLLTYREAFPWAESMRVELLAAHMPPYFAEPGFGQVQSGSRLTPRELDILLTWATGGTPEGPARRATPPAVRSEWKNGKPDLTLPMPAAFTLAADTMETTKEFVLATGTADRWIRAADLLPGSPAVVRNAVVFARPSGGGDPIVLALWNPGEPPVPAPAGAAFRWPAGFELVLRLHYLKTWTYDGKVVADRSTVGLFLAGGAPAKQIRDVAVRQAAFFLAENMDAVAIRVEAKENDKQLKVEATRPDGVRVPLISLLTRNNWNRRYWFRQPLLLPKGTRIDVTGAGADLWLTGSWPTGLSR